MTGPVERVYYGEAQRVSLDALVADAEAFAAGCLVQSPTLRAMVAQLPVLLVGEAPALERAEREHPDALVAEVVDDGPYVVDPRGHGRWATFAPERRIRWTPLAFLGGMHSLRGILST